MFTTLLDMVEQRHGLAVKDRVITAAALPNDGAYTSVGSYDHEELLRLLEALIREVGGEPRVLLHAFADAVFALFLRRHRSMIDDAAGCFGFLGGIEHHIHVEVRKLYPDAELPTFAYPVRADDAMVMDYTSPRPLALFAEGLIRAAMRHYGEPLQLSVEDRSGGAGTAARFTLRRSAA